MFHSLNTGCAVEFTCAKDTQKTMRLTKAVPVRAGLSLPFALEEVRRKCIGVAFFFVQTAFPNLFMLVNADQGEELMFELHLCLNS